MSPEQYIKAMKTNYFLERTRWERLADDLGAVLRKPSGIGAYEPIRATGPDFSYHRDISLLSEVPTEKIMQDLSGWLNDMYGLFMRTLREGRTP